MIGPVFWGLHVPCETIPVPFGFEGKKGKHQDHWANFWMRAIKINKNQSTRICSNDYNNFSSANSSCSTWSLYIFVPFLPLLGLLAVTMSCFYSTLYIHSINMNVWLSLRWNCMNCMRWLWTRFHRQLSRRILRLFFCSSGPSWTYSSDLPHLYTSLFSQPPLVVFSGLKTLSFCR